jgi:molybdenum cofactor biosynthesis protein MoaC
MRDADNPVVPYGSAHVAKISHIFSFAMPFLPLIGHDALRERLGEQIGRGALPASLLLQGPPGIGKQRLALWLGQRLLCEAEQAPCGVCQHCTYALQGAHPDLRWYFPRPRLKDSTDIALEEVARDYAEAIADRAESHGLYARPDGSQGIYVYVARLIVHQAVSTPAMARRKVFIVGDAERMAPQLSSQEAANAFLKLLEEPPADTTIILTSSEPGALLPTIRSRVVSVRVAPLTDAELRAFLAQPEAAAGTGGGAVTVERLMLAHGAPGALIGADGTSLALHRARTLLDAAGRGREQMLRAAFVQGSSKARGQFADVLDAMTVLLHERSRDAAEKGDGAAAASSARAVRRRSQTRRRGKRDSAARDGALARSTGGGGGVKKTTEGRRPKTVARKAKVRKLSHVNRAGEARMVDVGGKVPTARFARAEGLIRMSAAALRAIRSNAIKKGDVLGVARLAGIQAAKRTADLIPLCHPLALTDVQVILTIDSKFTAVRVETAVSTTAQTGVEMEALTAASVALLAVYDMTKSVDKGMVIERVRLLEKTGGKSGDWRAR